MFDAGPANDGQEVHRHQRLLWPGGLSWQNFYAAPLGAPTAIMLSGLLGFMAERMPPNPNAKPGSRLTFLGLPAGRVTAAITATGLLGTAGEASLLQFRGAYHNPFMFLPVIGPSAAAIVMGEIAVGPSIRNRAFSRCWTVIRSASGSRPQNFSATRAPILDAAEGERTIANWSSPA